MGNNENLTINNFPQGVRLVIDVIFWGQYRIGFEYLGVKYVPGVASYYPFDEAMARCYAAFCDRFPPPGKSQSAIFNNGDRVRIPSGDIGVITDIFDHDEDTLYTVAPERQQTVFVNDDGSSEPMEIYGDYSANELTPIERETS